MTRRIILVDIGTGLTLTGVLPSVLLYDDYAATLKARAGQPPYAYTIVAGALPDGLYLDRATGQITGTASAAGSFAFTVRVTDLSGAYVDRPFAITVTAEPLTLSGNAPNGTLGTAYAYSYTAAGGVPPRSFSIVAGGLPGGVSLNTSTGALSGTPTTGGSFVWTVRVEDSMGAMFDLSDAATVAYATLTLSGAFAAAAVGVAYSSDLTIAGGDGTYGNPHVTVGALPGWATLSVVGTKLRLSGTPTGAPTTVNLTVAADSGDGQTATSAQSFTVVEALVLDNLSASAVGAYSLRKLRNGYDGYCIAVRRSLDNAASNFGFVNGILDVDAVIAFVGSGDGFIYTWFDQSGNDRNFVQVSTAQPKLVSAGALIYQGARPAASFNSSRLSATMNVFSAGFCVNAVVIVTGGTLPSLVDKSTVGGVAAPWMMFGSLGQWNRVYLGDGTSQSFYTPTSSYGTFQIVTHDTKASPKISNFYVNGSLNLSSTYSAPYADTTNPITLGSRADGGTNLVGKMSEIIIFSDPLTEADRHSLERDQGSFYGISVP